MTLFFCPKAKTLALLPRRIHGLKSTDSRRNQCTRRMK